eukprot:CAMPEP_0168739730 /NCGR_PEP_ID=MMETSP0724-20121128/11614_1 /TAXON_ID=265536 /ORGANISM="Amphiprora sp., Strain CCMP467" /LENGTH=415 /DNA_ID=CAMNT_0008787143 /DNA_START=62 /DNA_END=1309 /DNA_ORIENTATION=+
MSTGRASVAAVARYSYSYSYSSRLGMGLGLQQRGRNVIQLQQLQQLQRRSLSSFNTTTTASPWNWPIRQTNTIVNIVPQGHRYVVERLGKMHRIHDSGLFLAIPLIDQIAYVIDVRERVLDIPPQAAITRDNVTVEVAGNLMVCFVDPQKAAYGALNPLYSVQQYAQSAMRSALGELELDELLHGRQKLNRMIQGVLQEAATPWGLEVRRYELTEITPDPHIRLAMDKQAAAERARREQVLRAEGQKREAELTSEGVRVSLENESQGNLIKVRNEAEAEKTKILLEAEATAQAVKMKAIAQAEALQQISTALQQNNGHEAARLALAQDYVKMYGQMGQQSNTILFQDKPADVNALLAQAVTTLQAVSSASSSSTSSSSSSSSTKALPDTNVESTGSTSNGNHGSDEEDENVETKN